MFAGNYKEAIASIEKGKDEYAIAKNLLAGADKDFVLVKELDRIGQKLNL
jgi:hypothetical protein